MKTFKKPFAFYLLLLTAVCWPVISLSQEWTQEEKEVLEVDKKMIGAWAERDLEAYMNCLHEDFVGWFQKDPLPIDKKSLRYWEDHWLSTSKIHRYENKPILVNVTGDVAVVFLYCWVLRENEDGKKLVYSKWTETFKKENGKWLIIAMSGGNIMEED